ncbi:MAG: NADPH-dependent F420 reductase [Nocardioidaceae bacterium]|jgi:NADPH-dependent F420 reductase|nr:NADPH-dependent F420 reductase [Nocardioidaceae bacterium]
MDATSTQIAIVGGTGPQGRGLAARFAAAGLAVRLGSRDGERAGAAAVEAAALAARLTRGAAGDVTGTVNVEAVAGADMVLVAVPWAAHADTLRELAPVLSGRIVIDCVNPLGFDERGPYALAVDEGSAAEQAQVLLPGSRVVAAFHHVSAVLLLDGDRTSMDTDVLVLGDDRSAADAVVALAGLVPGMRGVFAGRLRNAGQVEALTANLIAANRRYKSHTGVRLTGI